MLKPWVFAGVAIVALYLFFTMGGAGLLQNTLRQKETVVLPPPARDPLRPERELEIVSILPFDAIPAILNPRFDTPDEARDYRPDEPVLGVSINGESRAYSIPFLSGREVVNDVVGGVPIAVTW